MANKGKPLSAAAQKAAAQATLNESGLSLDEIAQQHPSIADGVALLKAEAESKKRPRPARGGTTLMTSSAKRTIL